ncbi:MAG: hypothetical protein KGH75_00585 [Rhodospirillales bacterium]|nr:hypothetical protein [Rhodospirillales bacterium]
MMTANSVSDALATAFTFPPLPTPPVLLSGETYDAMTGTPITAGYPLATILSVTTADIASTFPHHSGYVSDATARVFGNSKFTGNILAYQRDGAWIGMRPLVSRENDLSVDRGLWCDILPNLPIGTPCVAIFSDDSKRRLWPNAVVSTIGPHWRVYLHASEFGSALITIDHAALLECLVLVTRWYDTALTKDAMRRGILRLASSAWVNGAGWAMARRAESEIAPWRDTPELAIALYVAQHAPNYDEKEVRTSWQKPPQPSPETLTSASSPRPVQVGLFD